MQNSYHIPNETVAEPGERLPGLWLTDSWWQIDVWEYKFSVGPKDNLPDLNKSSRPITIDAISIPCDAIVHFFFQEWLCQKCQI